MKALAIVLAGFVLAASSVQARDVVVSVDARSGPWSIPANKKMKYGTGDHAAPVIVAGIDPTALGRLEIYADGTTATPKHADIDGAGIQGIEANDQKGPRGKLYPSFYAPKILYPAYAHALMGGFVDAQGVLVSRPFVIGTGVRVPIPEHAVALALGFNDESFAGNTGALTVTVVIPDN